MHAASYPVEPPDCIKEGAAGQKPYICEGWQPGPSGMMGASSSTNNHSYL